MQPKGKVRGLCRRGMLELDLILSNFFEQHYDCLTPVQQQQFIKLLNEEDPVLYLWLLGYEQSQDKQMQAMVNYILQSRRSQS